MLFTAITRVTPIYLRDGTMLSSEVEIVEYIQQNGLWEKLVEIMEGRADVVAIPTLAVVTAAIDDDPLSPHFSITPSPQTMSMVLRELAQDGCQFGRGVEDLLRDPMTDNVTSGLVYECNILLGSELADTDRTLGNIERMAIERGYIEPPIGLVPFLRQYLTDDMLRRMGIDTLMVMHTPVRGDFGGVCRVALQRESEGPWLILDGDDRPGIGWTRRDGFLYLHNPSVLSTL